MVEEQHGKIALVAQASSKEFPKAVWHGKHSRDPSTPPQSRSPSQAQGQGPSESLRRPEVEGLDGTAKAMP
jgi:hypothetical protein